MSLDNVEGSLQQFLKQLDSLSCTVRACQNKLSSQLDELVTLLPVEKQSVLEIMAADLVDKQKNITDKLIPDLHGGLDHRLNILRIYLHEH